MLLGILITITLKPISGKLLAPISFSYFFGDFSRILYETCFFVSTFCLPLFVCFYILARSSMAPSLHWVTLCEGVLWSQVEPSPWSSELGASGRFLVWVMWVLLEWLRLEFYRPICARGQLSGWLTVRINFNDSIWVVVQVLTTQRGILLSWVSSCWDFPLDMWLLKLIGSFSDVLWSWSLGLLVLRPLGRDSVVVQCQMLPMTGPEQSV